MSWNLNICGVFWTNQVQMRQNTVGRWLAGGGLQVPSGPWLMLRICSLIVLKSCMRHFLCLFLCIAMVLNGEEGLECEVHVDGICLDHASEF